MKGIVKWFDNDEGIVMAEDNCRYYFHYSAIQSSDKFKKLNKGDRVEFSLYENIYMKQIEWISKI